MSAEDIERFTNEFFERMHMPESISSDPAERRMMASFIGSGYDKLNDIACGKEIDYTADTRAYELLYNYCFYARNDALDKFDTAYSGSLNELRVRARLGKVIFKGGEDNAENP